MLLFALAILGGAPAGLFLAYQTDLPQVLSLEDFKPNIITQVFAADASLIGEFSIERRVIVEFATNPPVLRNAIVAVEDAAVVGRERDDRHLRSGMARKVDTALSATRSRT